MPRATRRSRHVSRRAHNSAAAFIGVIGVPDPGYGPTFRDGGLRDFCQQFNDRFDEKSETDRPEWRGAARAERELRALSS